MIFPNSIPTQFIFESEVGKKTALAVQKQEEGYEKMKINLARFVNVVGLDPLGYLRVIDKINRSEGEEKDKYFYLALEFESKLNKFISDGDCSPNNLRNIDLNNLTCEELENICKFLYIDYVPGTNMVNLLLWMVTQMPFVLINKLLSVTQLGSYKIPLTHQIFKYKIQLNKGLVGSLRGKLLKFQILNHMEHVKNQDRALVIRPHEWDTMPTQHIMSIARERGINIDDEDDIKRYMQKYWLPLHIGNDLSSDIMIWSALARYRYCEMLVE